ncbi:hypothetical protein PCC7424_1573 [Gloeothece citriformis PCC 7424]|uniref:Uncharacterized protein n=1 Tax=Gloeothece citriformis (strain PCC 7424) TaxID=65393 RepID=B7K9P4_GLOC7|nr:hypothetical protein [Gloeothece citriformis]ACK70012.1 hypothetical protein PCC7424_1573 [Gloeothece citriformis PCC 7424]
MSNKRKLLIQWFIGNWLTIAVPPALLWGIFWAYTFFIGIGLIGILSGFIQALILKRILPRSYLWAGVTTVAWFAGLWLGIWGSSAINLNSELEFFLITGIIAIVIGVAQGFLLMIFQLNGFRWMIVTIGGVALGMWIFPFVLTSISFSADLGILGAMGQFLGYSMSALIYSILTTIALAKFPSELFSRRKNTED